MSIAFEKQIINYYSYDNINKIEAIILDCYNYKSEEINLFTGHIYKIKNLDTNNIKTCIFDSLCNYNHDGILVTDEGEILGYDNYSFQLENPIKIKLYNSYKIEYKSTNKLFYHNKHLKISDLFYKGSEFKGVWVVL